MTLINSTNKTPSLTHLFEGGADPWDLSENVSDNESVSWDTSEDEEDEILEDSQDQLSAGLTGRVHGIFGVLGGVIGKTYSVGKSILGWAGKKTLDIPAVRGAAKWAIGNYPYAADAEESRTKLSGMRGTGHLTDLIDLLRPLLLETILDELIDHPMIPANFIEQEKEYFSNMISALLYKAIYNLVHSAVTEFQENNPEVEFHAIPVFFEFLMGAIFSEFDKIDMEAYLRCQNLPDQESQREITLLLRPACDVLVHHIFPRGREELAGLGKTVKWVVWSALNSGIADFLKLVYEFIYFPNHETPQDTEILEMRGGRAIRAIARSSAKLIRKITPSGIADGSERLANIVYSKITTAQVPDRQKQWLAECLRELAVSDSPVIERVWEVLEEIGYSLLCHALAMMARIENKRVDRNIIPDIILRLLDLSLDFIRQNRERIDANIERLKNDHNRELVNDTLMEHFVPLTNTILELGGIQDEPVIKLVKPTLLPMFFLDFYRDMVVYKDNLPEFHRRLQRKLFDEQEFVNRPVNVRNDNLRATIEAVAQQRDVEGVVLYLAGVKKHADDLEQMCGIFAEDVRMITEHYVRNNSLKVVELIRDDLPRSDQEELAEGIQEILDKDDDPNIIAVIDYLETLINATIFKLLVAIVENTPQDPHMPETGNRNGNFVANLTHRLFTLLGREIPEIQSEIVRINESQDSDENKELQCVNLFQPLALDILELAGENWMDLLPLANDIKQPLGELLKEDLLPVILHKLYTEMYGWIDEIPSMERKIDDTFGSTGSKHAISSLATYIEDYIPYYLEENPDRVVKLLEHTSGRYLEGMEAAQKNRLRRMMMRNIGIIGKDQENSPVWKACSIYSKAMILKMTKGVSKEISLNERVKGIRGESSFLLQTIVNSLEVAKAHFVNLCNIPEEGRISPAHKVKHSEILVGFKKNDTLHPALDMDGAGSPEMCANRRLEYFYKPLARDLIELAGIGEPSEFPLPTGIREEMFELFKESILPEILMTIFNDMLEPRNINKSMLTLIDRLNSTIEGLEDDNYIENDAHQRALNEACGEIIKSMVNLVPEIFTKTFFPADKIKDMTAEYIGGLVRRKLQRTNMLELMDTVLSSLNPPDPRQKEWRDYRAQVAEDRKVQRELIKKMTAYISKQVKETLKEGVRSKWGVFQCEFDRLVELFAGKPGLLVKKILDFIFNFIFFKLLGPLFEFLFFRMFWFFVDLIIVRKSIEIINDSHMKIHENLIFNLTGEYVALMKLAKDQRVAGTDADEADEDVSTVDDDDGDLFGNENYDTLA